MMLVEGDEVSVPPKQGIFAHIKYHDSFPELT